MAAKFPRPDEEHPDPTMRKIISDGKPYNLLDKVEEELARVEKNGWASLETIPAGGMKILLREARQALPRADGYYEYDVLLGGLRLIKEGLQRHDVANGRPATVHPGAPVPMILTCPSCGARHFDEGDFATKEHHTHACQECGMVWRPAIVPTVGVRFLPGFKNEK